MLTPSGDTAARYSATGSGQLTECTQFLCGDGKCFFVSGDAPLQAPEAFVKRSPVLVSICQQEGGSDSVALPLDDSRIRAWFGCVRILIRSPQKLASRYSDEELVKAWQVRIVTATSKFMPAFLLMVHSLICATVAYEICLGIGTRSRASASQSSK